MDKIKMSKVFTTKIPVAANANILQFQSLANAPKYAKLAASSLIAIDCLTLLFAIAARKGDLVAMAKWDYQLWRIELRRANWTNDNLTKAWAMKNLNAARNRMAMVMVNDD